MNRSTASLATIATAIILSILQPQSYAGAAPPVQVILDLDPARPGIQSSISVESCSAIERTVAVYIQDPLGERMVWTIGFIGAIDRGIALGHTPDAANDGFVSAMAGTPVAAANPANTGWVSPGFIPAFAGPELHYLEFGAKAPAIIWSNPAAPAFTATITIEQAKPGDAFRLYLLDYVSVWSGGDGGAFSVNSSLNSFDCGGDAVPDQTQTELGIDPDVAIPSPPAPYLVDFIDGPVAGGGAVINIIPRLGDITADGVVGVEDLLAVINGWGPCEVPGECPPDIAPPGGDGVVNVSDLLEVINQWGEC